MFNRVNIITMLNIIVDHCPAFLGLRYDGDFLLLVTFSISIRHSSLTVIIATVQYKYVDFAVIHQKF